MILFTFFIKNVFCADVNQLRSWTFNRQRVSKNAEIIIEKIKGSGDFYLMIQNKNQFKELYSKSVFVCNSTLPSYEYVSTFYVNTSDLPQNFPINPNMKGGVFVFTLYNCLSNLDISSIEFSFLNTWGRLPFEKYPLIFIGWIESAFYLVLFILCLINSIKHKDLYVILHYLIIGTVFIYTLSAIISALLYTYANYKDEKGNSSSQNAIYIVSSILLCFKNFCLLALTLFLVSGLSIIYDQLSASRILIIFGISVVFSVSEFFCDTNIDFSTGIYVLVCSLFIISYVIYGIILFYLYYHSMNTLDSHIVMIFNANIDPETTPTYRKKEMLESCRRCAMANLFFFVLSSILYRTGVFYYFISYLIVEIVMSVLLSIICYKCRLRYKMAATYCDDEQAYYASDKPSMRQISYDQDLDPERNPNQTTFQYQISNPDKDQDQDKNNTQKESEINQQVQKQEQSQNQLQEEANNFVNVLTNPADKSNHKDDEDLSLSSSPSKDANSDGSFVADGDHQNETQNNNSNAGNEANNTNTNESNANSMAKWNYGMALPPMPKEDFSQNKVYGSPD